MALNKSGLPPQKRPDIAAVRPGGAGTVSPSDIKGGGLGLGGMGAPKMPKGLSPMKGLPPIKGTSPTKGISPKSFGGPKPPRMPRLK